MGINRPKQREQFVRVRWATPGTKWRGAELDNDRWEVRYRLGLDENGNYVMTELHIAVVQTAPGGGASVPAGGVTTSFLRQIRLAPELRWALTNEFFPVEPATPKQAPKRRASARGRPREYSLSFYRRIGKEWNELIDGRNDRHPAKTLASRHGFTRTGMRSVLQRYDDLAKRPDSSLPRRARWKAS